MNRITRSLVALSILLSVPGLAPYQAAAQTIGAARVVVAPAGVGAAGAINAPALGGSNLSAASLQTGLTPSLTPSAIPAPAAIGAVTLSAPLDSALAVVSAAHAAPLALSPVAIKGSVMPAASKPAANDGAPAALQALNTVGVGLSAASKPAANDDPRSTLDAAFEGSVARPETLDASVKASPSTGDKPGLERSEGGPRWVFRDNEPQAPRTSTKRTWAVGLLGATIPLAITMISVTVAQLLGYQLHPNYQGPMTEAAPSIIQALAIWVGAAIMAPISEEAIFRGGMQGTLAKLTKKLRLGDFVVPTVIVSTLFVALHETSDPLLFGTRFVHAMILAWIYKKEGVLAAMAAHGFFNGLLALSIVFSAIGMPWLGLLTVPAAIWASVRAAKFLKGQKPDVRSGALAPKPLTPLLSLLFAALLTAGYFFLMPNIFWALGAAALLYAAIRKSRG